MTDPEQIDGQLDLLDQESDRESAQAALAAPYPVTPGRPPAIHRVWLKRFKQFEDFTLELGRFNVLVGPNNSGKSTLLQTIDLLYSLLKLLPRRGSSGPRWALRSRRRSAGRLDQGSLLAPPDSFRQRKHQRRGRGRVC